MRFMRNIVLLPLVVVLTAAASCVPKRGIDASAPITSQVQEGIKNGKGKFDHSVFDKLLKSHVKETGRVDYAALQKERPALQSYLKALAGADIDGLSRDELLALCINAYNAYTLDLMVANYPLKSIKDLDKPWDTDFCELGGEKVSLNFIEHQLLRPTELFDDPRMHFAINCASIGCPLLRAEAYTGDKIEAQLEDATRRTFQDERYLRLDGERVLMTKVTEWFKGDFDGKYGSLAKFAAPYAPDAARKILEEKGDSAISHLDYDWDLNDVAK